MRRLDKKCSLTDGESRFCPERPKFWIVGILLPYVFMRRLELAESYPRLAYSGDELAWILVFNQVGGDRCGFVIPTSQILQFDGVVLGAESVCEPQAVQIGSSCMFVAFGSKKTMTTGIR